MSKDEIDRQIAEWEKKGLVVKATSVSEVTGTQMPVATQFALRSLRVLADAAASERQWQDVLMQLAQLFGWRRAHFRPARVMRGGKEIYETPIEGDAKGYLDLEFVRDRLVKIEAKFGKNKPSPEQLDWMAAYHKAGVEVHLWWPRDFDTAVNTLK